jgi:hypothetical protein
MSRSPRGAAEAQLTPESAKEHNGETTTRKRWCFELPRDFPPEVVDEFAAGLARILVTQAMRAHAVRAVTDAEDCPC